MIYFVLALFLTANVTFSKAGKKDLRIIGGHDAPEDKYSYIVRLEHQFREGDKIDYFHLCTGTALTSTWVLTAAHCLTPNLKICPSSNLQCVVRHASGTPWKNYSIHEITEMVPHPNYGDVLRQQGISTTKLYLKHDIGLAKIVPLILNQYGKLSGVDYQALYGWQADIFGYGLTYDGKQINDTLNSDKRLQMLPVLMRKCTKYQAESGLNPGLCLSTRRKRGLSWVCPGDSGGPALHASGVAGVLSISASMCHMKKIRNVDHFSSISIVTAPVSPYLAWILDYVNSDHGRNSENQTY